MSTDPVLDLANLASVSAKKDAPLEFIAPRVICMASFSADANQGQLGRGPLTFVPTDSGVGGGSGGGGGGGG